MELRKPLWGEVLNYRRQGNFVISITEVLSYKMTQDIYIFMYLLSQYDIF